MPTFARMLHISDLHFPSDFKKREHSIPKNSLLARSLASRVRQLKSETAKTGGIDLLVGTGDISTDGTRGALEIARDFIERDELRDDMHCLSSGLSMGPTRRLIVPGNHDRYVRMVGPLGFQGNSEILENVFQSRKDYPYVYAYRRPTPVGALPDAKLRNPTLVFFVLNSTPSPYALASFWSPVKAFREGPAIGRLEIGDCERIANLSEDIRDGSEVEGLGGEKAQVENYEDGIRIAVLHHHPIEMEADRNLLDKLLGKVGVTTMENDNAFIDHCFRAGIDIVLFGHEHLQYYKLLSAVGRGIHQNVFGKTPHDIHFFCCPSTLAHYAKDQGFYLFSFSDKTFEVRLFEWKQLNFAEVKGGKINLRGGREEWPKVLNYRNTPPTPSS